MDLQHAAQHVIFAARGHICKLCVYIKNFTIVRHLGIACTIIFFHMQSMNKPTITVVALYRKKLMPMAWVMTVQLASFPRTWTAHFHPIKTQLRVSGDVDTGGDGKGMLKEEVVTR
jgi:hypothetical protein